MARYMLQVAIVLLLAAAYSLAARIPRATVAPTIISPSGLSQWPSGTVETVKWVSDQDLTGLNGTIYMGYIQPDGNPFLWKDQPLAENFSLADGVVNIRVPLNLPTGFRYVVSLSIDGDDSDHYAASSCHSVDNWWRPPCYHHTNKCGFHHWAFDKFRDFERPHYVVFVQHSSIDGYTTQSYQHRWQLERCRQCT
ncbi:hypothetical protein VTO73DRAFT_5881 [Trametes versicolor]